MEKLAEFIGAIIQGALLKKIVDGENPPTEKAEAQFILELMFLLVKQFALPEIIISDEEKTHTVCVEPSGMIVCTANTARIVLNLTCPGWEESSDFPQAQKCLLDLMDQFWKNRPKTVSVSSYREISHRLSTYRNTFGDIE